MDPATKILDPNAKPKPFSFPNGSLKRHHRGLSSPAEAAAAADFLYRECLKNHAASLGGHALDGCGEFMPSPSANPADPTSLKCAACGCHRNFHRRLPEPLLLLHHHSDNGAFGQESEDDMARGRDEDNDGRDDEEDGNADGCRRRRRGSASPPPYFSSAPHMLLALSTGHPGAPSPGRLAAAPQAVAVLPRKRFRTKFSTEQKERMHELSERLGWRMQKRDEGLVQEWCKEIGVGKGVFKVWMHNNKHTFLGSARRGQAEIRNGGGGEGGGGGGGGAGGGDSGGIEGGGNGSAGSCGGGNDQVVNGSSPSS